MAALVAPPVAAQVGGSAPPGLFDEVTWIIEGVDCEPFSRWASETSMTRTGGNDFHSVSVPIPPPAGWDGPWVEWPESSWDDTWDPVTRTMTSSDGNTMTVPDYLPISIGRTMTLEGISYRVDGPYPWRSWLDGRQRRYLNKWVLTNTSDVELAWADDEWTVTKAGDLVLGYDVTTGLLVDEYRRDTLYIDSDQSGWPFDAPEAAGSFIKTIRVTSPAFEGEPYGFMIRLDEQSCGADVVPRSDFRIGEPFRGSEFISFEESPVGAVRVTWDGPPADVEFKDFEVTIRRRPGVRERFTTQEQSVVIGRDVLPATEASGLPLGEYSVAVRVRDFFPLDRDWAPYRAETYFTIARPNRPPEWDANDVAEVEGLGGPWTVDHPVSNIFERTCELDEFRFDAPATDPDGDPLTYTWFIDDTEVASGRRLDSWTWRPGLVRQLTGPNEAFGDLERATIEVVVSDGRGGEIRNATWESGLEPDGSIRFDYVSFWLRERVAVNWVRHRGPGTWSGSVWWGSRTYSPGPPHDQSPHGALLEVMGDVDLSVDVWGCDRWEPGSYAVAYARGPGRVQAGDDLPVHPDPVPAKLEFLPPRAEWVRLEFPSHGFYDGIYRIDVLVVEPAPGTYSTSDIAEIDRTDPPFIAYDAETGEYSVSQSAATVDRHSIFMVFANGITSPYPTPEDIVLDALANAGSDCAKLAQNVTDAQTATDPPTRQQALVDGFKGCAKGLVLFEAADLAEGWCGVINSVVEEEHPLCVASKTVQTTLDTANAFAIPIPPAYVVSELALNVWGCANDIGCNLYAAEQGSQQGSLDGSRHQDLDLHVIDRYGAHVGMNYETGVYEVEIRGTETTGDVEGGVETIRVPAVVDPHFFVDARDAEEPLETYRFTMTVERPDGTVHEDSITQEIERGERLEHLVAISDAAVGLAPGTAFTYGNGVCDEHESAMSAPIDCDEDKPVVDAVTVSERADAGEPVAIEAAVEDDGEVAVVVASVHPAGSTDAELVFLGPAGDRYAGTGCEALGAGEYVVDLIVSDAGGNTTVVREAAVVEIAAGPRPYEPPVPTSTTITPAVPTTMPVEAAEEIADGGGGDLAPILLTGLVGLVLGGAAALWAVRRRAGSAEP